MTKAELKRKLESSGMPRDSYSLSGGLPNEAYCLEQAGDKWHVYYSERGSKSALKTFDSEQEACDYLFELVRRDSGYF
jgi:hypothetical protein